MVASSHVSQVAAFLLCFYPEFVGSSVRVSLLRHEKRVVLLGYSAAVYNRKPPQRFRFFTTLRDDAGGGGGVGVEWGCESRKPEEYCWCLRGVTSNIATKFVQRDTDRQM